MSIDFSKGPDKKNTEQKNKTTQANRNAAEEHGAHINPKEKCKGLDTGINQKASEEAGYKVAVCAQPETGGKGARRQQWRSGIDAGAIAASEDNWWLTMRPQIQYGDPAVTHIKAKSGDITGDINDVRHIVLHEPITWTREQAMNALTGQCYGVHFTVDRGQQAAIMAHAYPSFDICDHAGWLNDTSIGVEVINKFSTYDVKGEWIPPEERKYAVETAPIFKNENGTERKWKKGDPACPFAKDIKKNWILPTEIQMKNLYNLMLECVKNYNFPWEAQSNASYPDSGFTSNPNNALDLFPGVKICKDVYKGFYWSAFDPGLRGKITGSRSSSKYKQWISNGGIMAHAHAGSNHADGLFYEHYLYMRFAGASHKIAWNNTVAALFYVCGQYWPGHPSAGQTINARKSNGKPKNNKDKVTNFHNELSDISEILGHDSASTTELQGSWGGYQSGNLQRTEDLERNYQGHNTL